MCCFPAEIRCPPPPRINSTSASDASLFSAQSVALNSSLTYVCDHGYRFIDGATSATLLCDVSGEWRGLDGVADVDRCATVRHVDHARPLDGSINATHSNTERMVCEEGFQFVDGTAFVDITCVNTTGTLLWEGHIPDCERK